MTQHDFDRDQNTSACVTTLMTEEERKMKLASFEKRNLEYLRRKEEKLKKLEASIHTETFQPKILKKRKSNDFEVEDFS